MSTVPQKQLATKPKNDVQELLVSDEFRSKIALALPRHCTPDRFLRIALNALLRTPKLLECSKASVMKALLDLSAFGLEPDGRRAHLIPFGKEVQLIIDYKGLAELVRRSGDVSYIHADVVCEHDDWEFHYGSDATLHHKPKLGERGKVICAYSFVRLKDGAEDFMIMDVDELNAIKARSAAVKSGKKESPWFTDEREMQKKTVFRRHSKWLPLSPETRDVVEYDDEPTEIQASILDPLAPDPEPIEFSGTIKDPWEQGGFYNATIGDKHVWTQDIEMGQQLNALTDTEVLVTARADRNPNHMELLTIKSLDLGDGEKKEKAEEKLL